MDATVFVGSKILLKYARILSNHHLIPFTQSYKYATLGSGFYRAYKRGALVRTPSAIRLTSESRSSWFIIKQLTTVYAKSTCPSGPFPRSAHAKSQRLLAAGYNWIKGQNGSSIYFGNECSTKIQPSPLISSAITNSSNFPIGFVWHKFVAFGYFLNCTHLCFHYNNNTKTLRIEQAAIAPLWSEDVSHSVHFDKSGLRTAFFYLQQNLPSGNGRKKDRVLFT